MKIDQLIYFSEVAKEEHIGRAAKILSISPSAISHSIASLEGELQVKLFEKKGKNIFLTDQGRKLMLKSEDLISQFKNLKYELVSESEEKSHYSISSSHTISRGLVTKAWSQLDLRYPQTTVDLLTLRSSEVIKNVLNKEHDLGVCFNPQEHPELEIHHAYQGELLIYVRKSHPILKLPKKEQIKKISHFPTVLPKSFEGIEICLQHPMFKKFNIHTNAKTLIDSYDLSHELLLRSDYWSLGPDILIDKRKYQTIKPARGWVAPFTISVVWRKKRYTPQFFNDFFNELKNDIQSSR